MQTSFHHQPEAQHPNFPLSTSWQADYPIYWHLASFRCGAKVQTLLEVKRTCRDRRHRINPTRLTHKRHRPN
jgi:hypothetical protein